MYIGSISYLGWSVFFTKIIPRRLDIIVTTKAVSAGFSVPNLALTVILGISILCKIYLKSFISSFILLLFLLIILFIFSLFALNLNKPKLTTTFSLFIFVFSISNS